MDTIPTKDTLVAAFKQAPQYVKDFIMGDKMATAFDAMRTAHKLHLDDAGRLSAVINAVVLGLAPLGDFDKLVGQALVAVTPDERAEVIKEINDTIFIPMRDTATPEAAPAPEAATPGLPAVVGPTTSIIEQKLEMRTAEAPKTVTIPAEAPHPYAAGDPYHEPVG